MKNTCPVIYFQNITNDITGNHRAEVNFKWHFGIWITGVTWKVPGSIIFLTNLFDI